MKLDDGLKQVAVIGAAGKMGSGIATLLLQEIALSDAIKNGKVGSGEYRLTLVDSNEAGLFALRRYLRTQLTKHAEKNINALRQYYAGNLLLVSNEDMVRAFVEGALDLTSTTTEVGAAKHAILVFEAIVEDIEAKTSLFTSLKNSASQTQYYFTNTSSIPIALLNEKCQLQNRIIGFHFYNPPVVQKLLEIIVPAKCDATLQGMATELAKRMHKTTVFAKDVAGFIGNGHFVREMIFACQKAQELSRSQSMPLEQAIALVNRVTQELLVRPMGIFQLMDYVGIDICRNIAQIISKYLPDPSLHDQWLDAMVVAKAVGGQNPDGSQKNGCFQYEKQTIKAVYSLDEKQYKPIDTALIEKKVGKIPIELPSWKSLQADRDKEAKLSQYFNRLMQTDSLGADLARAFLENSQHAGNGLVQAGIARKQEDVDMVLQNGFFHLYGSAQQNAHA